MRHVIVIIMNAMCCGHILSLGQKCVFPSYWEHWWLMACMEPSSPGTHPEFLKCAFHGTP